MSLTQWFTRSWPTVSCRPASMATLSFVPTPSALATSTGLGHVGGMRNMPPNPPNAPRAPAVSVDSTSALMRRFASSAASMSTPAAAIVERRSSRHAGRSSSNATSRRNSATRADDVGRRDLEQRSIENFSTANEPIAEP